MGRIAEGFAPRIMKKPITESFAWYRMVQRPNFGCCSSIWQVVWIRRSTPSDALHSNLQL
ncbi:hypothetical protein RA22_10075 [Leisingera sp. ANG-S]|nr:hypothetical protein RA22_10075 [Leisingera sp. ANG-S]